MVFRMFFKTREDGVDLYRTCSNITPKLRQVETGAIYNCWIYKVDDEGNETNEVDWSISGVVDLEDASFTYEEVM